MLSASSPSLRLGFSGSDFIFILPRVPPLTRLHPGLIIYRPAITGLMNSAHIRSRLRAYWRFAEVGACNSATNSNLSIEMFNVAQRKINFVFYFLKN